MINMYIEKGHNDSLFNGRRLALLHNNVVTNDRIIDKSNTEETADTFCIEY